MAHIFLMMQTLTLAIQTNIDNTTTFTVTIFTFSEENLSGYLHVLSLLNFINQLVSYWISSKFHFC